MSTRQNMLRTMIRFASRDGIPSLWWGISASMLRQSTYSTARFGLYNYFAGIARERTGQRRLPSSWEIVCAGAAGGLAGLVGNPTEVRSSYYVIRGVADVGIGRLGEDVRGWSKIARSTIRI
ncbi:hypothetical protein AYO21_11140 [Fonsecaea monophora]|uniref:Mitochondrial thiamine pyrophosphate carrier 1 n=1 Tax=Fonsecaea monophora TaxID=254056 RepID=A0A177ERR4_9EURO|nr:hypothetical protein AYO21_11140 [Fonsecaea monophora]OAG34705.1 hypothetical protein AYO21_11140 [Fonsecaea monophora]